MYLIYLLHVRPIPGIVHNSTMHHISQVKWVANNVMLNWNPYIISQSKECMKKHCFTFIWCSLFLSLMDAHVLSTLNCTVQTSRDLHCKQAISLSTPIAGALLSPRRKIGSLNQPTFPLPQERSGPHGPWESGWDIYRGLLKHKEKRRETSDQSMKNRCHKVDCRNPSRNNVF